jgi:hypothetical protein
LVNDFADPLGLWAGAPPVVVLILFLAFSFFNAMYTALTGVYPRGSAKSVTCSLTCGDAKQRPGSGPWADLGAPLPAR